MKNDSCPNTTPLCGPRACTFEAHDRRTFLSSAGHLGLAMGLLGLAGHDAVAATVSAIESTQSGSERRYPIPAADGVSVDRSASLILVRLQGRVYVFALSCPHQNNALKWVANDHRFQCTKHDSRYQPDGVHISGRATRNMDRYVIRRDGDAVVVDLHHWIESDKDPAGWAAASLAV